MAHIQLIERKNTIRPGRKMTKEEAKRFALTYYQKTYKYLEDK